MSEMSGHAQLLDKACYGPLEGQAEWRKEHLKRHILLWRSEKPSFTQSGSLSLSPSYFLLSTSSLTHTQRKHIIIVTVYLLHRKVFSLFFKVKLLYDPFLGVNEEILCDLHLI